MARTLGFTLLILGLGGTALGGAMLGAPAQVRDALMPPIPAPTDRGPRPELPAELAAATAPQEARDALRIPPPVAYPPRPVTVAREVTEVRPTVVRQERTYAADAAARAALVEAERAYRAMDWAATRLAASKVQNLDANPAFKTRAREVLDGSKALEALFAALNDRDELARGYDTHPSLVRVEGGREPLIALPIRSLTDKEPVIIDRDPLGYIQQVRTTGKVPMLVRGRKDFFTAGVGDITKVTLVDQRPIAEEKRREFQERLSRLSGSAASLDPVAWYEAGRFAYRNRLDDLVVPQLDQALRLDPALVRTVREDRAAGLFAHLMAAMKVANKPQAAAYMTAIDRRYKDTDQAKLARLYYDGKQAEFLRAAQQAAIAPPPVAAAPAPVAAEVLVEEMPVDIAEGSTPEAQADAVFAQGRDLYARAIDLGNTKERDQLYAEADRVLTQAVSRYQVLVDQAKDPQVRESLEIKLVEANKLRFGSKKQRRF